MAPTHHIELNLLLRYRRKKTMLYIYPELQGEALD
jgi:hypothetical protein